MAQPLPYEQTTVSAEKSMGEIRKLLIKYGATSIQFTEYLGHGFEVACHLPLPEYMAVSREECALHGLPARVRFTYLHYLAHLREKHPATDELKLRGRAERVGYRAAYYYLKAVFEVSQLGFMSVPQALLAGYVGPDGRTFAETVVPRIVEWAHRGPEVLSLPEARE